MKMRVSHIRENALARAAASVGKWRTFLHRGYAHFLLGNFYA